MSKCRFMYDNLVDDPSGLTVSSARPGAVGLPAPEALGSALCHAVGPHLGTQDQVFVVEIDNEGAGGEVGSATFRWRRGGSEGWEASGVPTSATLTSLADGVGVKWAPGAGQDLYKGDRWSLLAVGRQGEQPLCDRDRDTRWQATGCEAEWVQADLGAPTPVGALVLADHNLGAGAGVVLKGTDTPEPDDPVWSFDPAGGELIDSLGQAGSNTRTTGRTYMDGGVLKYAAAGETCFEDGELSIQPAANNLLLYSEQFDNAVWDKNGGGVVVTANQAIAPDGTLSADFVANNPESSASPWLSQVVTGNTSAGQTVTFPIWIKSATESGTQVLLRIQDDVAPLNSEVEATAEWQRLSFTKTFDAASTVRKIALFIGSEDGVYIWGAQLETGPIATAYIPTTTAPASRAADGVRFPLSQRVKNTLGVDESVSLDDESSGAIALSIVDGAAFAMPGDGSGADLSTYADGAHVLQVVDGAGKIAWARLGAAGTGETLGSELLANPSFDGGTNSWSAEAGATLSSIAGGQSGNCLQITCDGSDNPLGYSAVSVFAGGLYRFGSYVKEGTEATYRIYMTGGDTSNYIQGEADGTWAYHQRFFVPSNPSYNLVLRQLASAGAGTTLLYDEASVKQVLTPPATGVWLESTPGAADKTLAYIQSGFNANAITDWAVYPAAQWRAEGTLVMRGFIPAVGQADMSYCRLVAPKTAEYFFYINPSGALVIHDGSSGTSVTPGFVAGLSYDLAARWSSSTGLMQVGYKLSSDAAWTWGGAGAFDGGFTLGSYLNLGYSPGYPFQIGDIELHDSWLADPLDKSLSPWDHPDYSQAISVTSPHLAHFLDASHRHWRLELADPGNPDGALAASLLYLGDFFEPERTFAAGFTRGTVAGRRLTTSDAGKVSGSATALATYYELSFPRMGEADADAFEAMMAAIHPHLPGGLHPLFFTPFSGQPGDTLYCLPSSHLTRRRLAGGRWDLGLRLEEVVRTDA